MRFSTSILGAALLMVLGVTLTSRGQKSTATSYPNEQLKTYLRDYLSLHGKVPPDTTTRITAVKVETDNRNDEDVVYISGQRWCGSGGCMLLILEPVGPTFKILGRITIVQLPIRLLSSRRDGHPDIGVTVQGGGVQTGYEAVLSFNGKSYPGNPSLPPARKINRSQGKVIIANAEASIPLYD